MANMQSPIFGSGVGGTGAISMPAPPGISQGKAEYFIRHMAAADTPPTVSGLTLVYTGDYYDLRAAVYFRTTPEDCASDFSFPDTGNHTFGFRVFSQDADASRTEANAARLTKRQVKSSSYYGVNQFYADYTNRPYTRDEPNNGEKFSFAMAVLTDKDSNTRYSFATGMPRLNMWIASTNPYTFFTPTIGSPQSYYASNAGNGGQIEGFAGYAFFDAMMQYGTPSETWGFDAVMPDPDLDAVDSMLVCVIFLPPINIYSTYLNSHESSVQSSYIKNSTIDGNIQSTFSLEISSNKDIYSVFNFQFYVNGFICVAKKGAFGQFDQQLRVTGSYGGDLFQEAQRSILIPHNSYIDITFSVSSEAEDKYRDALVSLASLITLSGQKGISFELIAQHAHSASVFAEKNSSGEVIVLSGHEFTVNYRKLVDAIADILVSSWTESVKPQIAYRDLAISVLSSVNASFFRESFGAFSMEEQASLIASAVAQTEFILRGFSEMNLDARRASADIAATLNSPILESRKNHMDLGASRFVLDSETKRRLSSTVEGRRILELYYSAERLEGGN